MSAIDTQNAKQIRDPMDVLIQLDVRDSISMTYSGYSSTAKVADGLLNTSYTMRKLADLQGDGFALDGTAKLYQTLTPSQSNGKLGVRGNVGQTVSVTASTISPSTIKALSLTAKNAASVTVGGTTTSIVGNQAIIQVNANSVTMTFNPADATHRIEVSAAVPGAVLTINNDNLIRATVSLRSDLSLYGQTLPESELNVEVYNDSDISESVASIADDVPITYQAGYPGDMSPVRKFYVSGKVTWKDNVLSIHAVDAVHFLDAELPSGTWMYDLADAYRLIKYCLNTAGVNAYIGDDGSRALGLRGRIVAKRQSMREVIASIMWMIRGKYWSGTADPFAFTYVDAGIPKLTDEIKTPVATISEDDVGDHNKQIDRTYEAINLIMPDYDRDGILAYGEVGRYDWYKDKGAFISIDEGCYEFSVSLTNAEFASGTSPGWWSSSGAIGIIPADSEGYSTSGPKIGTNLYCLLDSSVAQEKTIGAYGGYAYTQVVPWNAYYKPGYFFNITSQAEMWNFLVSIGVFGSTTENWSGVLWGRKYQEIPTERLIGGQGATLDLKIDNLWGSFIDQNGAGVERFPEFAIDNILNTSPVTGSFRWKGDPRMQPRDVVTFRRLDGTDEDITLENITLTHEQGGTSAEITYRKGVI